MLIITTEIYRKWFDKLKDQMVKDHIRVRLLRIEFDNNFGDAKSVSGGISEIRIHLGPGYRIYYTIRGNEIIVLLMGAAKPSKSQQQEDIKLARRLAKEV
jgi:putative addiction module killer protein